MKILLYLFVFIIINCSDNSTAKKEELNLDYYNNIQIVLQVDASDLIFNSADKNKELLKSIIDEIKNENEAEENFFDVFERYVKNNDIDLTRHFNFGMTNDEIILNLKSTLVEDISKTISIIESRISPLKIDDEDLEVFDQYHFYSTIVKSSIENIDEKIYIDFWMYDNYERIKEQISATGLLEFHLVKNFSSTNAIIRQIDQEEFSFSSLLISVGGNLAIASQDLSTLKNILSNEDVKQILEATNSTILTSNSSIKLVNEIGEEEEFYSLYHLNSKPEMVFNSTDYLIKDAQMRLIQSVETDEQAVVEVKMNSEGSREWARITGANINNRIAIVLDKKVHMAPVIRSQIVDRGTIIEGLDSVLEAKALSGILTSGIYPFKIYLVEEKFIKANKEYIPPKILAKADSLSRQNNNEYSSVECQRYDVMQGVRKHLKSYNRNVNSGQWEYWAEELPGNTGYDFDITQSGNTFVAKVSTIRTGPAGNEFLVNVGTFTFLCSNNGKLTLSSAFGLFDD